MMNRKYFLHWFFCCACVCITASEIRAQSEADPEKITFGVGITFYPASLPGDLQGNFQASGLANIIVPIQIGPHIFIEPELGFYRYDQNETLPDTIKEHVDHEIVRTGFGVFYSFEPDKSFKWYLGGRLGILSSELHITHSPITSAHAEFDHQWGAFYAGAAFGVEYFFSPHFSIGGEIQINHIGYGEPVINENPYPTVDSAQSVWSTNAALSARFYF
jgi:hypothetical protein